MTRAIVDASVMIKTVVDQPLTANARTVIASFDLSAPSVLAAETVKALLRYVRAGLSQPVYDRFYLSLPRLLTAFFITADLRLLRKGEAARYDVINLADVPASAP